MEGKARSPSDISEAVRALLTFDSVSEIRIDKGRVLIYREHLPQGLFLVLDGVLALTTGAGMRRLIDRVGSLVPGPGEVEQPSKLLVETARSCRLLFIPRSLLFSHPEILDALRQASIETISLKSAE